MSDFDTCIKNDSRYPIFLDNIITIANACGTNASCIEANQLGPAAALLYSSIQLDCTPEAQKYGPESKPGNDRPCPAVGDPVQWFCNPESTKQQCSAMWLGNPGSNVPCCTQFDCSTSGPVSKSTELYSSYAACMTQTGCASMANGGGGEYPGGKAWFDDPFNLQPNPTDWDLPYDTYGDNYIGNYDNSAPSVNWDSNFM